MARKTKGDWIEAGLAILVESGAQALTIEQLLKRVGVSKGSFYHHFAGYDDYVEQFLHYFEQEGTLDIIKRCNTESTPLKRLRKLIDISTSFPAEMEVAMRAWSQQDERVSKVQATVDARRLAYLEEQFIQITRDEALATTLSQLTYSILIGSEHIKPPISGDAQRALFGRALAIYGIVPR